MIARPHLLALLFLLAPAAAADTVYKYRRADGQVTYSNRPIAGLELVETFEYRFPPPAAGDAALRSYNELR